MDQRKPISKKIRFEVFKRDNFECQYCGASPPKVVLEVDHIIPVSTGGENNQENLVTSCFNCNRGKSNSPLNSVPSTLAEQAANTKEGEIQLKGYYKILKAKKQRIEKESWQIAEIMKPGCSEDGFSIAWLTSIKNFLRELNYYEVEEAMEIAVGRMPRGGYSTFRYFCGVCWNRIGDKNG